MRRQTQKSPDSATGAAVVREARKRIGLTQSQMASALGVSAKAIQSYEQGWRTIPDRVLGHMLALVSLALGTSRKGPPCWDVRACDDEKRAHCLSHHITRGKLCWLVKADTCSAIQALKKGSTQDLCPVMSALLRT